MEASFVDLRKKSADIIRALKRKERVTILYRGKPAAIMEPISDSTVAPIKAEEHGAFGIWAERTSSETVDQHLMAIRRRRYDAL